jgi:hypothetical protein
MRPRSMTMASSVNDSATSACYSTRTIATSCRFFSEAASSSTMIGARLYSAVFILVTWFLAVLLAIYNRNASPTGLKARRAQELRGSVE